MPVSEHRPSFLIEAWTLYAIGTSILFTRFAVRFKTVGLRGLQGDDFFSLLVLLFYTVDAFTVHMICMHVDSSHCNICSRFLDFLGTNIEGGAAAKTHSTSILSQQEV